MLKPPETRPWSVLPVHPLRDKLAKLLGLLPVTAQVLAVRGYTQPEEVHRFLRASVDQLSEPRQIADLAHAARVVWRAVRAGRPVVVYGDFDADGVCAAAILIRGLRSLGVQARGYVPHRLQEGYGLHADAVRTLAESGCGCLVAVDCGVGALQEVALAKQLGMTVVVVDHHEPPPVLPEADAVVDPKIAQRLYPFRDNCASGLAWQLVRALRELAGAQPTEDLLELAAVGTVADVVPLVGDNRVLVRNGLRRLEASPLVGLQALLRACGLVGPVSAEDVAWRLAPRLNAAGRVDTARTALQLLLTDDPEEAQQLATELDRHNAHRQRLHEVALGEALAAVDQEGLSERPGIVVWGEGWHPGVVGLVAGRLRESFFRPSVALTVEGGRARGSARGVPGLDLVEVLGECAELVDRFGGHALAAGLELPAERLVEFRRRFEAAVGARVRPELLVPRVEVEAEVTLEELTPRLVEELALLEPFGAGNPRPTLAVRGVRPLEVGLWGAGEHLWLRVTDGARVVEAVGFGLGGWGELLAFCQPVLDLAGCVERSRWQEGELRWVVEDLKTPGLQLGRVLADVPSLLQRLLQRADDYLSGAYRAVEVHPALFTKVVGVTFEGRQEVLARLEPGEEVYLRREPANPFDPHAVQVVRRDGSVVGYLNSVLAGRLAPQLDRGARYRATVAAVTGGGDLRLGVNVRLEQDAPQPRTESVRSTLASSGPDLDRLSRLLWPGGSLPEPLRQAAARVLEGGRAAVACSPWPECSQLSLLVAAAHALRGTPAVVVFPMAELAESRWQSWKGALEGVGLRLTRLHGLVSRRELEQGEQAAQLGALDVVFTTPTYLSHRPGLISPEVLVVVEGWVETCLSPELASHAGPFLWVLWDPAANPQGWEVFGLAGARTAVRVVDARGRGQTLEELLRDSPAVVFAAGPASAVELARSLSLPGHVAYDHPGLPSSVRDTLAQLFNQGKLTCLVCGGPAPDGLRAARRLVWVAPTAMEVFLQQASRALASREPTTLVLGFGREEGARARAEWESLHPPRQALAAVYRLLREAGGEACWPDEGLSRRVREATGLDPRLAVPAALQVLEAADLVRRERAGTGWRLHLYPPDGRKDLGAVLRFAEGERSRAAFASGSRWLVSCSAVEVLERVAGGSVAARRESGAG
ncbi:MAG: single-stranded-DNA-specific exonuclease RecJ [candidate division GAL15 bacterium]